MRGLMIAMLLAGTIAVPALAQERDPDGRRTRDRSDQSAEARSERRAERVERRIERADQAVSEAPRQRIERARADRSDDSGQASAEASRMFERRSRDSSEIRQIRERRGDRLPADPLIASGSTENASPVVIHRDRTPSAARSLAVGSSNGGQWSNHWRGDRRYDWRSHRQHHHSLFRLGNYWDPYGYRYSRFSIGFNLWPSYYGSQFWLNDPWQYRLPPTYGPYRWVRYYDDALLVNIYTGQVVDVERNFFW